MKILFSTFGSLGDLHPYIAVALEAKGRGHQPVIATAAKYRAKIESLGLEFRAVRPDLPAESDFGPLARRVMDLKDGPRFLFQDVLSPALRDSYADLLAASHDAEVIITHPAALAGPLVAQKLRKKWLSSVLAPISLWSKFDPPVPPTIPQLDFLRALGPLWPTIMFALGRRGTAPWVAEVEKLRQEIGVESLGHPMFEGQFSPFGTLALFSRHFAAPQKDWPVNTTATGFCFYDADGYETQKTEVWREWIEEGEAPIIFTLGSSAVHDAEEFWESAFEVNQGISRLLFIGADANHGKVRDFEEMLVVAFIPYSVAFARARGVVHQGGIGTVAQALRAGVPQIVMPYAHDQPDNARRLRVLGVGLSTPRARFSQTINKLIKRLEYDDRMRAHAQQLGTQIRAENGPLAACEAIERLCL